MNMSETSKTICFILRHKPEAFNLKLDEYGYVNIDSLAQALHISSGDILNIVKNDIKKRYKIKNGKIKCNFGHSIPIKLEIDIDQQIPDVLYHGTKKQNILSIKKKGLISQSRNYVHLTSDLSVAKQVGMRYAKQDKDFIRLTIKAKELMNDGYKIYSTGTSTFLIEAVPQKYIIF